MSVHLGLWRGWRSHCWTGSQTWSADTSSHGPLPRGFGGGFWGHFEADIEVQSFIYCINVCILHGSGRKGKKRRESCWILTKKCYFYISTTCLYNKNLKKSNATWQHSAREERLPGLPISMVKNKEKLFEDFDKSRGCSMENMGDTWMAAGGTWTVCVDGTLKGSHTSTRTFF